MTDQLIQLLAILGAMSGVLWVSGAFLTFIPEDYDPDEVPSDDEEPRV